MTVEEEMSDVQMAAFEIISYVGSAKSKYIEAISKAKAGDFDAAAKCIEEGNEMFYGGHDAHLKLLQQSAIDDASVSFSLILIHAEDQMMQAESFRIIAEDFIDVYHRLGSQKVA